MIGLPLRVATVVLIAGAALPAGAAEAPYPFEGGWIRSDRTCTASSVHERIYTAREVTSSRGRCTIRKIAAGSGVFELFERCERPNEKPGSVKEVIRITGTDTMTVTRQTERLKLSRALHYTRCPLPTGISKPAR